MGILMAVGEPSPELKALRKAFHSIFSSSTKFFHSRLQLLTDTTDTVRLHQPCPQGAFNARAWWQVTQQEPAQNCTLKARDWKTLNFWNLKSNTYPATHISFIFFLFAYLCDWATSSPYVCRRLLIVVWLGLPNLDWLVCMCHYCPTLVYQSRTNTCRPNINSNIVSFQRLLLTVHFQ